MANLITEITDLNAVNNKRNRKRPMTLNDQKSRFKTFERRSVTLKKKASELAMLCDVNLCMISFGPNGDVDLWPENNPAEVKNIVTRYKNGNHKSYGKKIPSSNFSETKQEDFEGENMRIDSQKGSDDGLEKMTMGDLTGLMKFLDSKLKTIEEKIEIKVIENEFPVQVFDFEYGFYGEQNDQGIDLLDCLPLADVEEDFPSNMYMQMSQITCGDYLLKNNNFETLSQMDYDSHVISTPLPLGWGWPKLFLS